MVDSVRRNKSGLTEGNQGGQNHVGKIMRGRRNPKSEIRSRVGGTEFRNPKQNWSYRGKPAVARSFRRRLRLWRDKMAGQAKRTKRWRWQKQEKRAGIFARVVQPLICASIRSCRLTEAMGDANVYNVWQR